MHANDVEVVRVYTRRPGSMVADQTFPAAQNFELVIECEVGATKFGDGGSYRIGFVVRDLSACAIVIPNTIITGTFGDATWPTMDLQYVHPLPAQGVAQQFHIYEAIAFVTAGNINPDVSFARSPMLIIT